MASSCSECKWLIPGTGINAGRCTNEKKVEKSYFCLLFEQKGALMGTCKECRWWEDNHSYGFGTCHKMMCTVTGLDSGRIRERCPADARGEIPTATFENFGCVHFEAKRQGPLEMCIENDRVELSLHLNGRTSHFSIGESVSLVYSLERIVTWLNENWPK